jgi:regulator of protease activity HflC (stomatin/prohibitin superfamily)
LTDKEFKQLSRAQLIDIIYQFQLQVDNLTERNRKLEEALADRRLRIHNAGNLAEAALEINDCFRSAQNAAEQFLDEIKTMHAEAEAESKRLLAQAQAEAERIVANAQKKQGYYDSAVEAILNEYGQNHSDNG